MAVHVDLLLGDSVQELLFIDTIQFQKTTSSPLRGTRCDRSGSTVVVNVDDRPSQSFQDATLAYGTAIVVGSREKFRAAGEEM